ncbi:hypothetical protein, partial [Moraxella cuniculi]|uniref:hypothetical protein n=1 Tax=Moraxella cuniculi TaxID=34061 RepID=UPI001300D6CD
NGAELTLDDVVGSANADDFETLEFSNGVTVDNNGKIIVPAGVKEFTISMKTVEDSTTEGDETVQFTIGGVKGNEATIKDTSTTPVPPTTIKSLDMADNLTDENKVLINGQEMAPETVYPNSNATYGVGQVASGNGDTALSLATGLTNDRNVNLLINLEGPLGDGQTLEVVRYTIVNGNRTNAENVTANIAKVDDKTYQVAANNLPQTYGTDYQYEVVLKTNGVEAGKQTYDFRLDSEVEGLDVTKANIENGNLQLELTAANGNSEKGAFVYAQWNSGGTVQSVQFVGTNGVYTANLQGFNYKDPAGLTLTIVDAAGNVSSQKVNLIRNLFSEYNENLGPDTTGRGIVGNDGGYDDANRLSGRQQVTGAPNGVLTTAGNDTLIIGMDQFGALGALNGSLSDEGGVVNSRLANINTGAGDDYILVRGIMQAFAKDATIQMGDGNDKFQVNDAIVGYVANPKFQIDMGEGNNIINIKKYIGAVVQSTITFGSGNDMFLMGENWDGLKNINFGAGDDILNIGGYINNIGNAGASEINFGEGNDQMIVGTNIDDLNLILNFGDGNNYLQVNESFVTGKANFGGGDDVVVLNNFSRGGNLGSNTDNLQLNMGAGNDQVTINGRAYRGLVDMGDGDDTLTVNETYLDSNTNQLRLEGGAGNDTIVLNGSTDDHSMRWIKNFETVDMKSSSAAQTLRVTLNYLEQDDDVQALYIKGGSEDKVKLGNKGNLEDDSKGGAAVTWTKMDAMQQTVDGVTYDAYTVSSSTEWVYIQQGVQVI